MEKYNFCLHILVSLSIWSVYSSSSWFGLDYFQLNNLVNLVNVIINSLTKIDWKLKIAWTKLSTKKKIKKVNKKKKRLVYIHISHAF